jgi:hypothetical protein
MLLNLTSMVFGFIFGDFFRNTIRGEFFKTSVGAAPTLRLGANRAKSDIGWAPT